jgi:hypothetical protein
VEFVEDTNKELESFGEVRLETFLGLLSNSGQSGGSVLFNEGDTGLDQVAELLANFLETLHGDSLIGTFIEVGESGASVGLNAGNLIIEALDDGSEDVLGELLLEVLRQVVSELTNAVEGSISDLGVRVLQVLDNDGHHLAEFIDLIDVLTNLGEGHDTGVFVSPVILVRDGVLDELSNEGEHHLLTNGGDESVDAGLTEGDVVLFLGILINVESFLGLEP